MHWYKKKSYHGCQSIFYELSVFLYIALSTYIPIYQSIYPSIYPRIGYMKIYTYILSVYHISIIYPSIHPLSLFLSWCLSKIKSTDAFIFLNLNKRHNLSFPLYLSHQSIFQLFCIYVFIYMYIVYIYIYMCVCVSIYLV